MIPMEPPGDEAIRQFVDEYRGRCLWFLNPGYYPATREEVLRVLESIQRHGDVNAFRRAGELKQWVRDSAGRLFRGRTDQLAEALRGGAVLYHAGSIRGAFPRLV